MNKAIPILLTGIFFLTTQLSQAGSATWNFDPVDNNWNNPANWTPNTVPNGPNDVATFGQSNIIAISISAGAEVNTITFNSGASAFTITVRNKLTLTVSGIGIINNSGIMQNFVTDGVFNGGSTLIQFTGDATAGDLVMFTNEGNSFSSGHCETNFFDDSTAGTASFVNESFFGSNIVEGGRTQFLDRSSAGEGTFLNLGTDIGNDGGATIFMGESTAAEGTFIINGVEGGATGTMSFLNSSNAGNGNFTLDPGFLYFSDTASAANGNFTIKGGQLYFWSTATIGNATLIANGAVESVIFLLVAGTEGTARIELFDTGTLVTQRDLAGVGIGALEGNGIVDLGRNNPLIVGSNNLSTTFSGTLQNVSSNGLLEKVGTGTLTLSGANTYTGTTTVSEGTLLATNLTGSATGTGVVKVQGGTLGGGGTVSGAITVGTGAGSNSVLDPAASDKKIVTLVSESSLTFKSDATYRCTIDFKNSKSTAARANDVTIDNASTIVLKKIRNGTLAQGKVFKIISNTSANQISGTFSNLADGAIVNVGGTNFQADYQGGDGNDLTLTVLP
jgi:autotransporter-associated beta strand protein